MRRPRCFAGLVFPILMSAACSGGGDEPGPGDPGDPGGGSGAGNGRAATAGKLELLLVDAPSDEVRQIVVTIARVDAHVAGGGGWVNLLGEDRTVDLLSLRDGSFASLGVSSVPAGRITQVRLELNAAGTNHVVTRGNRTQPLEVPSGTDTGIKINAGFDWPPCANGVMTIDFDGKSSLAVHPRGAGGGEDVWQLRPVIHLRSVELEAGPCGGGGADPDAGAGPGAGNGNGNGNGKGNGQGGGNGKGNGKGMPGGGGQPGKDPAGGGVPRACAAVSCPVGAQFCLNGTCHDVTAP